MPEVITKNLDLWTSALLTKSTAGRASNGKLEAYGIKKLRELILDLAMRGKLIEQDQNDEPPYEALKRTKHWPLKTDKNSGHIPDSWISVPLEILAADTKYPIGDGDHGQIRPACYTDLGVPYIRVADLGWGTFEPNGLVHIPESVHEKNLKSELRPGDILIAKTGATIGKCCIVPASIPRANTTSSVGKVTVNQDLVLPKWIIYYFLSGGFKEKMWAVSKKTAQPGFNIINLKRFVVPVPSIAEQHRVVAKVDELMALCDQLEQQQTHSIEAHQTLVDVLLGTLTRVASQQELSEAWTRIVSHFDTLFTNDRSIDQLKQTILQLAAMGKLVHQDPNDEPAGALLTRIAKQKERLVAHGEIRKQKPLPAIDEEEKAFGLPKGWAWCRLQEIVYLLGDGLHGTPEYSPNERYYFINGNNLRDGEIAIKSDTKTVAQDQYDKYKKPLGNNSVLVSINGTLGSVAFFQNEEIILGKSACFFNLAEDIYKRYIKIVIDAPSFNDYANKNATGTTIKNLGLAAMNSLPIALPPKQEQQRIVTKVDELMALCDVLKARLADAHTTQIHLADAIVEQAIA